VFESSKDLTDEISKVKSDIKERMPNCDDFEELWASFLEKIKINKVLNDIDNSNRKMQELKKQLEAKAKIQEEKARITQKALELKQRNMEEEARSKQIELESLKRAMEEEARRVNEEKKKQEEEGPKDEGKKST
jgi:fumarylacetoacetate (FAA) hydrolase family protein